MRVRDMMRRSVVAKCRRISPQGELSDGECEALEKSADDLGELLRFVNRSAIELGRELDVAVSYELHHTGAFFVTLDMPDPALVDAVRREYDGDPRFAGCVTMLPPNEPVVNLGGFRERAHAAIDAAVDDLERSGDMDDEGRAAFAGLHDLVDGPEAEGEVA